MVATRRTAPTGADKEMPDPELALRKKPVRKASAKQTAKTETKAKTTRGKKSTPAPEMEDLEAVEEPSEPRATRGRPKKAGEVVAEPEPEPQTDEPTKPAKATKPTKSGPVRGRKAEVAVDQAPETSEPEEAKPARRTRAAASKAAPLSPKKITQVAKPQTRIAKTASKKAAGKAAAIKGPARGGATTRGRAVSDENADVPVLDKPVPEDDSVIVVSSTPMKKPMTRRQAVPKQTADESEISMSTRETTPAVSPAPSQATDTESQADAYSAHLSTPEKQGQDADGDDSDDELCGPKTPMRRGSPGAAARYHSSAQRTIRKYNEEQRMQTPARRYALLGSQRGTPQTQKPYCKPAAPSSEVRPMTVARGANRAFVFRDLRDGAPQLTEKKPQQQKPITEEAEEEDVSFIPDENIIPVDEEAGQNASATPTPQSPMQLASSPTSSIDIEEEEEEEEGEEGQSDVQSILSADDINNISTDSCAIDAKAHDPDATTLGGEHEDDFEQYALQGLDQEPLDAEDTVIINRPQQSPATDVTINSTEEDNEDSVIYRELADPQSPETMVWENVHSEQAIPVNFDDHLSDVRTLPQTESTEVLNIASTFESHVQKEDDALSVAEESSNQPSEDELSADELDSPQEADILTQTPALDLSDYFDMTALTEPTQAIGFALQPSREADMGIQDAEPTSSSASAEEDEEREHTTMQIDADEDETVATQDSQDMMQDNEAARPEASPEASVGEEEGFGAPIEIAGTETEVPHYAQPTFAFDARRKSLPATGIFTRVNAGPRPNTSDGASIPRAANLSAQAWCARSRANSITETASATPRKVRQGTAHVTPAPSKASTSAMTAIPKERYPMFAPWHKGIDHSQSAAPVRFKDVCVKPATRRQTFHRAISGETQEQPATEEHNTPAKPVTPARRPNERYPTLEFRATYVDHSQTVVPPARFQDPADKPVVRRQTMHNALSGKTKPAPTSVKANAPANIATSVATTKERYPTLSARSDYVDHAQTVKPATRFQNVVEKAVSRRQTIHRAASGKTIEKEQALATPVGCAAAEDLTPTPQATPGERIPRLRPRGDYQEHAKTVTAPRFKTPRKSPLKRPATTQKPTSMRKAALQNSSSTPMKTPLKAAAMTPGQEPMTPHPAAPLRGVIALVEVYTLEGASASAPFAALLHRLGAKTTRTWTDRVTHVIFKDGSPTTLQRVRLHNKDVQASREGTSILCVNSRWVSGCDTSGNREDESDEAYAVDVEEVPRGGKRRRKSMEPSALVNLGGNVVRDRTSSLGRSSIGRSSTRSGQSPAKKVKASVETPSREDKENSDDEPGTPAWIAEPDKLVQQTAPMKRVKKLELHAKQSRRLTFWDGGN